MTRFSIFFSLFLALLCCGAASGQTLWRVELDFPSVTSTTSLPFLIANIPPNSPVLAVCNSPSNSSGDLLCTNYATTYTGQGVACPNGAQDTPSPNSTTSPCQSTGDAQGNIGFWVPLGKYDYMVQVGTNVYGPYTVTAGIGGGGGTLVSITTTAPISGCSSPCTSTATIGVSNATSSAVGTVQLTNDFCGSATSPQVCGLKSVPFCTGFTPTPGQFLEYTTGGTPSPCYNAASASNGFPSNPQTGDTLRYNIYGDNQWEAVNFGLGKVFNIFYEYADGTFGVYGASAIAAQGLGSLSNQNATTSDSYCGILTSAASASTSTVIGLKSSGNSNYASFGIGSFYRWTHRFAAGNTTNVRYWQGLTLFNSVGGGTSSESPLSTTSLATDTPSRGLIGFRFSAGTDTHWQAAACLNAGTCTFVDTGVTPDTNPHFFDMATNPTFTTVTYFIDGVNVGSISANLPPYNLGTLSSAYLFWTGDNKNTATAVAGTECWMGMSPK